MKIQYIANIRMPTEKAHGVQIVKTCEAIARIGAEVELVVPARRTAIQEDSFAYYGAEKNFIITRVPVLDLVWLGRVGFWLESLSFAFFAAAHAIAISSDIIYSRDELPLWLLNITSKKIAWESHTGRNNFLTRRLLRAGRKLVVISRGLEQFYKEIGARAAILVAPDAIDLVAFAHAQTKEASRKRLRLPQDKVIAMYIGRLDGWKGVDSLLEASKLLPDHYQVAVIGGEKEEIQKLSAAYPRVVFLGAMPYKGLADNQAAADILTLPNTAKDTISARFTSPMKLFSYMAAGKPIVASDLPSIREVLSEDSALFFTPDDAHALAAAIISVGSNEERSRSLAQHAKAEAEKYTWARRAEMILSFLQA